MKRSTKCKLMTLVCAALTVLNAIWLAEAVMDDKVFSSLLFSLSMVFVAYQAKDFYEMSRQP